MRYLASLLLVLGLTACAHAQIGQIDGRIASTFGGEIDTSAKANGYVLTYQSSTGKWIAAAGGGGFSPTITTPTTGDILRYNGSAWVNVTTSTVLDTVGSTRGSVLYRGASGWAELTPGASGTFLKSNGAGADPSYASAGGGSFDPAAATNLTFAAGQGLVTGSANTNMVWSSPDSATFTRDVTLRTGSTTGTTDSDYAGNINVQAGNGPVDGVSQAYGGYLDIRAGNGGNPGNAAFAAGGSYFAGVAGGTISFASGSAADGNSGPVSITIPDAAGTNRSGGLFTVTLGNKTGSGTASSLDVKGAASATVFKVSYDGVLTMTSNSTGAGTPLLGTNCPASTLTAPYTWVKITTSDGSTAYLPAWK